MKIKYETPKAEKIVFDNNNVILTSAEVVKNPGNHPNCTIMPSGKPIPPNATRNRC